MHYFINIKILSFMKTHFTTFLTCAFLFIVANLSGFSNSFNNSTNGATSIKFTEKWTWAYTNIKGEKNEMILYRSPLTQEWMIPKSSLESKDETLYWIIIKADGEVIQANKAAGKGIKLTYTHHKLFPVKNNSFAKTWTKDSKTKAFDSPKQPIYNFQGIGYNITFPRVSNKAYSYVSQTNIDFNLLTHFNDLNSTNAKLPIQFSRDIPYNYIHLSEELYMVGDYTTSFEFLGVEEAEIAVNF